MTREEFFEKFELFSDAPGAVAHMRELILRLAVRGKLVEQRLEDGTAKDILIATAAVRESVTQSHGLFRSRVLRDISDEEIPFMVPSTWIWTRLGTLCRAQAGFAFESVGFTHGPGGLPIIRIRDIRNEQTQVRYVGEYRDEFIVETGDYLVGMDGNFTVARWKGPRALLNQRVTRLQWFSESLEPMFFAVALQHRLAELQGAKAYTTVDHLSSKQIEDAPVPLPPLSEQKRIVAKVDELMALCDRLEAQQKEREARNAVLVHASLARFADAPTTGNLGLLFHASFKVSPADLRKTILTLAARGKLVPKEPPEDTAGELLSRLERDRQHFARQHNFKIPPVNPVDESSTPFDLPPGWIWCRLGSLFNSVTDGDHLPPPKSDTGIAFLTIGNMTTGTLRFDGSRFVPHAYYRQLADIRRPSRGDILYSVVGATYGRAALVDTDRPFCVQRHIAILKPSRLVDVRFMLTLLRSPLVYEQATSSATGTAQPTIPLGSLRNFLVPLPPISQQRTIAAKVDELMAVVDTLESDIESAVVIGSHLFDAVITEMTASHVRDHGSRNASSPRSVMLPMAGSTI